MTENPGLHSEANVKKQANKPSKQHKRTQSSTRVCQPSQEKHALAVGPLGGHWAESRVIDQSWVLTMVSPL